MCKGLITINSLTKCNIIVAISVKPQPSQRPLIKFFILLKSVSLIVSCDKIYLTVLPLLLAILFVSDHTLQIIVTNKITSLKFQINVRGNVNNSAMVKNSSSNSSKAKSGNSSSSDDIPKKYLEKIQLSKKNVLNKHIHRRDADAVKKYFDEMHESLRGRRADMANTNTGMQMPILVDSIYMYLALEGDTKKQDASLEIVKILIANGFWKHYRKIELGAGKGVKWVESTTVPTGGCEGALNPNNVSKFAISMFVVTSAGPEEKISALFRAFIDYGMEWSTWPPDLIMGLILGLYQRSRMRVLSLLATNGMPVHDDGVIMLPSLCPTISPSIVYDLIKNAPSILAWDFENMAVLAATLWDKRHDNSSEIDIEVGSTLEQIRAAVANITVSSESGSTSNSTNTSSNSGSSSSSSASSTSTSTQEIFAVKVSGNENADWRTVLYDSNFSSWESAIKVKTTGCRKEMLDAIYYFPANKVRSLSKRLHPAHPQRGELCSICYDSFKCGHKIVNLGCGHSFCCACILRVAEDGSRKCPYCRQVFV